MSFQDRTTDSRMMTARHSEKTKVLTPHGRKKYFKDKRLLQKLHSICGNKKGSVSPSQTVYSYGPSHFGPHEISMKERLERRLEKKSSFLFPVPNTLNTHNHTLSSTLPRIKSHVVISKISRSKYNDANIIFYRNSSTNAINGPVEAEEVKAWQQLGQFPKNTKIRVGVQGSFQKIRNIFPTTSTRNYEEKLTDAWRRVKALRAAEKSRTIYRNVVAFQHFSPKVVRDQRWLWPTYPRNPRSGLTPGQASVAKAMQKVKTRRETKQNSQKLRKKMNAISRTIADAQALKRNRAIQQRQQRLNLKLRELIDGGYLVDVAHIFNVDNSTNSIDSMEQSNALQLRKIILYFHGKRGRCVFEAFQIIKNKLDRKRLNRMAIQNFNELNSQDVTNDNSRIQNNTKYNNDLLSLEEIVKKKKEEHRESNRRATEAMEKYREQCKISFHIQAKQMKEKRRIIAEEKEEETNKIIQSFLHPMLL